METKIIQVNSKARPALSQPGGKVRGFYSRLSKLRKGLIWGVATFILVGAAGGAVYLKLQPAQTSTSTTNAMQTAVARQGNLVLEASGTGTLIPVKELSFGFGTSGTVTSIAVKVGDSVKQGQVLAQLDSTSQELALVTAQENLAEMTSPEAIANAKLAITTAQADVTNAQIALNNTKYWKNDALIQDYYAKYVIAKANLDRAQTAYDNANVGEYINNSGEATIYQALYNAQQAYKTAEYYYSLYSQKPTQRQLDEAQANLDLANATLTNAQIYLTALTGGEVPADATGTSLLKLKQANLAVQTAQENLDATKLTAPFAGMIMSIGIQEGESAGSGSAFTIADLSHADITFYMDQSDWTNVKTGYVVNVIFDALPNQTFTGKVTQVQPGLISVGGTSMVEGTAELDEAFTDINLPTGVSAAVDVISAQAQNAILVPVEALHKLSEGKYAVFVMQNGTPTLTMVEVGIQDSTFAEIKSGVTAGDVVTTGIVETK